MSNVNSGASTPRSGGTPPPGNEGPSPLTVGTRFVKQYYKILSTEPDQIGHFYQPSSYLSHGVGSQPTQSVAFEKTESIAALKDRFYLAQVDGSENCPIRFEFEHGAIDAQVSVNNGILLVVTGHIVYLNPEYEEEDEETTAQRRFAFVHTFFLGALTAGGKRSYYVHNDVLRFLHDDEEKTVVLSNTTNNLVDETADAVEHTPPPQEEEPVVDEPIYVETEPVLEPIEEVVIEEAPGGGVEESKEVLLEEEDVPETVEEIEPAPELAPEEELKPEPEPETEVEVPAPEVKVAEPVAAAAVETKPAKPPGSWASLVARSGGTSAPSNPSTPVRPTKAPPSKPKPSPTSAPAATAASVPAPTSETQTNSTRATTRPPGKRDPDCTLVIKNIGEDTTEADVLDLFGPFAAQSEASVVGTTVSTHKGIAFVDYDKPAPVLAAVEQHQAVPFQLKDHVLDVYQKTLEQRGGRRGQGGGRGQFRGGPNNGSTYRGGGGGGGDPGGRGRQQYRRGGGRGDRGGGGGRGGRSDRGGGR